MKSTKACRRAAIACLSLMVLGCSAHPPGEDDDNGIDDPAWDLPSIDYVVLAGDPISAPLEAWTFVAVEDALCANGSSTGIAVNLTDRSDRVLIFLAGGGACWEAAACAAGTAVHIQDTLGEAAVLGQAQQAGLEVLFDREDPANAFRDASFVYVPYCTGDFHSGTRPHTYDWFGPRVLHHVGAQNMDAYLRRLQPTFPEADRVWLGGVSAGGLGATMNWWKVQKAFPWARVDVLNDSGTPISTAGDGRWGTMRAHWGMEFPPGCPDCESGLANVFRYSSDLLASPRRYALLNYVRDEVIGTYFGLDGDGVQSRIDSLRNEAASGVKTYYLPGTQHVVLSTPDVTTGDGVSARAWTSAFAEDETDWDHEGP